jgi:hypothetical protein
MMQTTTLAEPSFAVPSVITDGCRASAPLGVVRDKPVLAELGVRVHSVVMVDASLITYWPRCASRIAPADHAKSLTWNSKADFDFLGLQPNPIQTARS